MSKRTLSWCLALIVLGTVLLVRGQLNCDNSARCPDCHSLFSVKRLLGFCNSCPQRHCAAHDDIMDAYPDEYFVVFPLKNDENLNQVINVKSSSFHVDLVGNTPDGINAVRGKAPRKPGDYFISYVATDPFEHNHYVANIHLRVKERRRLWLRGVVDTAIRMFFSILGLVCMVAALWPLRGIVLKHRPSATLSIPVNTLLDEVCQFCEPPEYFTCPISMQVMRDPVVAPSGRSYERVCIEEVIRTSGKDPLTRQALRAVDLRPNRQLKDAIDAWCKIQMEKRSQIASDSLELSSTCIASK